MTYSNSTPLSYGPNEPLRYYANTGNSNGKLIKTASGGAALCGLGAGAIGGAVVGATRNPYIKNGVPSDSFARAAYNKYARKADKSIKEPYEQCNEVLSKIGKVNSADELRTLMGNNPEASKEVSATLGKTPEEFLKTVTDKNLGSNKKVIKQKLESANELRFQNMKNNINLAWNEEKHAFVKPNDMEKGIFKAIKKASRRIKASFIAKYALIGGAVTGAVTYLVHRFIISKKHNSQ